MSRKYERNDKIALLYPANLLAAQTYFQLSFVFVYSSESYLAGEILLHFGGIHVFVPYVEQFCRILSVSYALSASRYFIRN